VLISKGRFAVAEGCTMLRLPWSTPMKEHKKLNGTTIVGYADVVCIYQEGNLIYGTYNFTIIEFDCNVY